VSPISNTTYAANFTTQYLLTDSVSPSGGGTVTANPTSSTGYYNSGTSVQLTAAANSGYTFLNWSGALSGSTAQQSLVLSAPRSVTANFQSSSGAISFLTGYALNNPILRSDFAGWVGMNVVIGTSPLTVSSLGRICVAGNTGIHTVEFVNASTSTVVPGGSAQVKTSGCTPGQFVYTVLSPSITLQANTAYYLASQEFAAGDQWYNLGTVSSTAVGVISNPVYSTDGINWALADNVANTAYVPPNFTYSSGAP
jgi:hypothetical protein